MPFKQKNIVLLPPRRIFWLWVSKRHIFSRPRFFLLFPPFSPKDLVAPTQKNGWENCSPSRTKNNFWTPPPPRRSNPRQSYATPLPRIRKKKPGFLFFINHQTPRHPARLSIPPCNHSPYPSMNNIGYDYSMHWCSSWSLILKARVGVGWGGVGVLVNEACTILQWNPEAGGVFTVRPHTWAPTTVCWNKNGTRSLNCGDCFDRAIWVMSPKLLKKRCVLKW